MGPKTLLTSCPRDVFRDAIAYSCISKRGGKKVRQGPPPQLSGMTTDGGERHAEVLEYALPDGRVIARLVKACGMVEAWLETSLATDVLIARSDAEAEKERVIKEVIAYANATRSKGGEQTYVLSSACLHAAVRHQAKIGRLYDRNSRGDKVRGNLSSALARASKAGV
jgi:hypothetical protein